VHVRSTSFKSPKKVENSTPTSTRSKLHSTPDSPSHSPLHNLKTEENQRQEDVSRDPTTRLTTHKKKRSKSVGAARQRQREEFDELVLQGCTGKSSIREEEESLDKRASEGRLRVSALFSPRLIKNRLYIGENRGTREEEKKLLFNQGKERKDKEEGRSRQKETWAAAVVTHIFPPSPLEGSSQTEDKRRREKKEKREKDKKKTSKEKKEKREGKRERDEDEVSSVDFVPGPVDRQRSRSRGQKSRSESRTDRSLAGKTQSKEAGKKCTEEAMGRGPLLPMASREEPKKVAFPSSKRWEAFHGDNTQGLYDINGGKIGLRNLCNTCFMNAGLQCLSHVEPVAAYFLTGKYKQELNLSNPLGCGGKLATEFSKFLKLMWSSDGRSSSSRAVSPKQMHRVLEQFAPHLMEGYEQQDVQEFLAYMLDGLSEDLNLVKEKPPPDTMTEDETEKMYADMEDKYGEEYVAAMHWKKYLLRNKSFLVDICQGQLRSILTCTECGYFSKTYDPYLYLSLPVNVNMRSISDSLNTFLVEETLDGDDRWRCKRCKKKVVAKKKMDIYKAPSVLILHLKRFSFNYRTGATAKVNTFLDIPLTLNLSEYIVSTHKDSLTYDVIGVCNHTGPHGFGHYTCTCKHPMDNSYYHFNDDEEVFRVDDPEDVISASAYVLFLLRHAENDPLRRQTITLPDVWPHWVSKKDSQIVPIPERERIQLSGRNKSEDNKSASSSAVPGETGKEVKFEGFMASGQIINKVSVGSSTTGNITSGKDSQPDYEVMRIDGRSDKASSSGDRRKDSKETARIDGLDEDINSRSPVRESTPRRKKWLQNLKSSMDFKKDRSDSLLSEDKKRSSKKDKKDKKKSKKGDDDSPRGVSSPTLRKGGSSFFSSRKNKRDKRATGERKDSAESLPADTAE